MDTTTQPTQEAATPTSSTTTTEPPAQPKQTSDKTPPKTDNTPLFDPPKKKLPKWVKVSAALAVVGGLSYVFFIGPMIKAGRDILASGYFHETAQVRDVSVVVSSTGTVKPIDSYNVTPLVTGDLLEAPFEEGDIVRAGDLLFHFDDESGLNSLAQAQLNIDRANLTYRQALESVAPYATGAGIIQTLHVKNGDPVGAGTLIATISDNSAMTIKIPFHASQTSLFSVGSSATITLETTLETLYGSVVSISGADEVGAGNVVLRQVEFRVTNPGALGSGTSATASVGTSEGEIYSAGVGTFESNHSHQVYAGTSGEISSLYVREGSSVSYGTQIASIGGTAANATLENARISVQSAILSYESAQKAMEHYTITAPISGTVIEKKFKAGDTLDSASLTSAGGNLAVIYDMSSLTFEMEIHELDINKIELGQKVLITADAVEGATFTGVVDTININGVTMAGMTTYPITVIIDNPEGLKPGMNVAADVLISSVSEVITVPIDAVIRGEDGAYVLVAEPSAFNENGTFTTPSNSHRVFVELGANDENYIEITSGLTTEDIVIWENQTVNMFQNMVGSTGGPMGGF
ncbi:MAG: efflux RND transporter periplasmic adaptor subunit [Eubacteriales bacterium]